MRDRHPESFSELQLPVIIDLCERPADPNESAICPLCPAEMALLKLQVHLASHLEELSLFVLPVYMSDQSQTSGSNQGGCGNDDQSRMEDLPSLGSFSDAGVQLPTNNDPTRISNLVKHNDSGQTSTTEVQSWLGITQETQPWAPTSVVGLEIPINTSGLEIARRKYADNDLTYQSSKSIGTENFEHRTYLDPEEGQGPTTGV